MSKSNKGYLEHAEMLHDYGIHFPTRTIYIGSLSGDENGESGVDYAMAERAVNNISLLEEESHDPMTIKMNNVGGDFYHGMAIHDRIIECESKVTIKIYGHCMSMGSVIFQAADIRLMSINSRQMLHYGIWGTNDHAKTAQKWAEENKKNDKWMEKMYLEKIKHKQPFYTLARLQRLLDHDTLLTAQESVDLGLADGIIKGKKK